MLKSLILTLAAAALCRPLPAQAEGGPMSAQEKPPLTELRRRLTPEQYKVTQERGTEVPFLNAYWDNHAPGIYVDVVSGEPLFSSTDKFDSGTGWPSFSGLLDPKAVRKNIDMSSGMRRVEVRSRLGDNHLGHVFRDGPPPEHIRYCINSAALRFVPADKLESEGYGQYRRLFSNAKTQTRTALFAAGCFWHVEESFSSLPGVLRTEAGYSGGTAQDPTYQQVCAGKTGHAETVRVEYDPSRISYEELLTAFWRIHDPTTLDRQGPDVGSQYRSAIFYADEAQKRAALASKAELEESRRYPGRVVTQIVPAGEFTRAEEHHQQYYAKQGGGSCGAKR